MRKSSHILLLAAVALQCFGQGAPGQPAATAPAVSISIPQIAAPQGPNGQFEGSVPQGTASDTALNLTLGDAITRGLKANLGLLTSEQSSVQLRAQRLRALSTLLPNINGQIGHTIQQIDLQTIGINFPGVPAIVGPFSYQSALATANVPIFNFSAISGFKAAREELKASALSVKNARDLVVQAVGNAYLQIIADAARVQATQAEIDADVAVYNNASRRHEAGTAIGLDVLRSQVEVKQRQQQLVVATNQLQKDKLTLGRVIGLPIGQDFAVADPSPAVPLDTMDLKDALTKAYANRPDFQGAKARVIAAEFEVRAAHAQRYPVLGASGYYGDEGKHLFTQSHGVFTFQGTISFNIFDGGRIHADEMQYSSELKNRRNELDNLRSQIDYEVRTSLMDLKAASDELAVARSNTELAEQSMQQSKDRFAAGVTNTVEVVQAQQAVADANESLISAQYQYNVSKVELARSLGLAEESMRTFFK